MAMLPIDPTLTKAILLTYLDQFDVVKYATTRNHLSGGVSRLSPYLTRGVITLSEIRERVLARYPYPEAEKFIQELAWREYWQQVWWHKGEDIFTDLRFPRTDWQHHDLVMALTTASSDITVVDQAITTLYETGYMHNHARMWTAMLACNVAKAHWYDMSRWLYYYLVDGDIASNTLSWQWVAGTNASKRYVANQALINACSGSTQTGTYLDCERELVGTGSVPAVLQDSDAFQLTTSYPPSESYEAQASKLFLYSPWTLNPDWRAGETGERILLLEPRWFDRFPVAPQVLTFVCTVARTQVPDIKVVVANANDLQFGHETKVFSQSYPATRDWPGTIDPVPRLFPDSKEYHSSFFKFWSQASRV